MMRQAAAILPPLPATAYRQVGGNLRSRSATLPLRRVELHAIPEEPPIPELSGARLAEVMALVRLLGTAEIAFAGSLVAPIFWTMAGPGREPFTRSGSLFFLDAGAGVFGVTAAHVVASCLRDAADPSFRGCLVARHAAAPFPIDLSRRIIALHEGIDVATLRFTAAEATSIGRTILTGFQAAWPPRLARIGDLITYAGFPGLGRNWLAPNELRFGLLAMAGVVTNAREDCISVQIERDALEQTLGDKPMPEDFDFGGTSGGPVLRMVERNGLRGWALAGVIFQGPNPTGDPA